MEDDTQPVEIVSVPTPSPTPRTKPQSFYESSDARREVYQGVRRVRKSKTEILGEQSDSSLEAGGEQQEIQEPSSVNQVSTESAPEDKSTPKSPPPAGFQVWGVKTHV